MRMIIVCMAAALIWSACNNEATNNSSADSAAIDHGIATSDSLPPADTVVSGCYSSIVGRDTILLQIEKRGNNVNGTLSYNIYEKDRNDGTFQGEMNGDVITAWYLFKSEGVMSVRQEAWKIQGTELQPAIGTRTVRNDTTIFTSPDQLRFDDKRVFKKVVCVL